MKIGIFIKNYAIGKKFDKSGVPNKSGAEFHAENHAKILHAKGNQVYIMTKKTYFFTKAREFFDGIDLVRLHAPIRWLEIFIRLLTTHKKTDAFYILGVPKFSVWVILFAKFVKKPVTLSLTSKVEVFDVTSNWRNKIFGKCDNYIAISNEIAEGLKKKSNISEDKISILPQGVDTKNRYYPVSSKEKLRLREKYNLDKEKKILLFCARVVPNKGTDTLISAWKIIHEKCADMVLLIVGGGFNELLDELRSVSAELDNSIIVIGEVPKTEPYYQLSDMYILPSWFEGLSTSVMEAMSCGLPCIGSKIGGIEDLIAPANGGILVDTMDYQGFAKAVLDITNDEVLYKKFSSNAREYAVNNLDCDYLVDELSKVLCNY